MGGPFWTSKELGDRDWLATRAPRYAHLRDLGTARKKNRVKDAYVIEVYEDYDKQFPGRIASLDLPKLGLTGELPERKKAMIKRLNKWFGNHLRDTGNSDGGKHDVLDLSGKQATLAMRKEKKFETYARLFKDRLNKAIGDAYDDHLAACKESESKPQSELAFRNSKLAEMLKAEPEDVQKQVEASQMTVAEMNEKSTPKWLDEDDCDADELERRKRAFELHRKLSTLALTLERAGRTFKEMGYNSVIVVGGPEPRTGGKIKVVGMTNGCTITTENEGGGQVFEDYFNGWQGFLDGFGDFCHATTTPEERLKLSLSLDKIPKEDTVVETAEAQTPTATTNDSPTTTVEPTATTTTQDLSPIAEEPTTAVESQSKSTECDRALPVPDDMGDATFLDTGSKSGFLVTKKFGDTTYKYYAPHRGTNLSLQQLNDNSRAFNKAIAIFEGLISAPKATTTTSTKTKAASRKSEEKGTPAPPESRRVTRAEAKLLPAEQDVQSAESVCPGTILPADGDVSSTNAALPTADNANSTPPSEDIIMQPAATLSVTNIVSIAEPPSITTPSYAETNDPPSTPTVDTSSSIDTGLMPNESTGANEAVGEDSGAPFEGGGVVEAAGKGGAVGLVAGADKVDEVDGAGAMEGAGAGQEAIVTANASPTAVEPSLPATATGPQPSERTSATVPAGVLSPRSANIPNAADAASASDEATKVPAVTANRRKRAPEVDENDIIEGQRKRAKLTNRYGISEE